MTIISAILAVIFALIWLGIQKAMRDQGITPLSRGQLKYWRRKARKAGVGMNQVAYRPRKWVDEHTYPREDIGLDADSLKKTAELSAEYAAMSRYLDTPVNPGTPSGHEDPETVRKAAEAAALAEAEWAQMQRRKDIPVNPGTPSGSTKN